MTDLTSLYSVFLAAPLRKQVIVKEKLVFPSGSKLSPTPETRLRPSQY